MNRFFNSLFLILLVVSFFAVAGYAAYIRITNVDMTETRLFLTYWKQLLLIMVIYTGAAIGYEMTKGKK
jgi:hypothetical protein